MMSRWRSPDSLKNGVFVPDISEFCKFLHMYIHIVYEYIHVYHIYVSISIDYSHIYTDTYVHTHMEVTGSKTNDI